MTTAGDIEESKPREIELRGEADRGPSDVHSIFMKAWWALEKQRAELVGELPELRRESDKLDKKANKAADEASRASYSVRTKEDQIRAIEDQQIAMRKTRVHLPGA